MRPVFLLALLAAAAGARAAPVTYDIDPTHSIVHFEVQHFGTSTIRGRFGPVDGEVMLDREAGKGRVALSIEVGTVSTGVRALDNRLRQDDLLATAEHPLAYFVAEQFRFAGERVQEVRGEFTLRGVSRPLSLTALHFNCYQHPLLRREVCGGDFEARFLRSEFGATFGLPVVRNEVRLLVSIEAVRKE